MKLLFSLVTALATTVSAVHATSGRTNNQGAATTGGGAPPPNSPAEPPDNEVDDEPPGLARRQRMGVADRPTGPLRRWFEPWAQGDPNKAAGLVAAIYALAFGLVPVVDRVGGDWLPGAITLGSIFAFSLASRLLWHWSGSTGRDLIGGAMAVFFVWAVAEWLHTGYGWRWLPTSRELVVAAALGLLIWRGMLWMRDGHARPVFLQVLAAFLVAAVFISN